ncbi:MAG: LysR family transcriptional regulator, partial [Pseudomonadota bacterium]
NSTVNVLFCSHLRAFLQHRNRTVMDNWDEVKTAYTVGALKTITAAADALGVHRATVIRHIDSLEEKLGLELFIRNSSGYAPTESGRELIRVARATNEHFGLLSQKLQGLRDMLSGELHITSPEFVSPLLVPGILEFQSQNPNIRTEYVVTSEVLKLDFGEAHLAVRVGPILEPEPDNVFIPFFDYTVGLFASSEYAERNGLPKDIEQFNEHVFVDRGLEQLRAPFEFWLRQRVPENNFVFSCESPMVLHSAVAAGIGIGFMPPYKTKNLPGLIEVIPKKDEWSVPLTLVAHRQMHATEKVKKLIQILTHETYTFP